LLTRSDRLKRFTLCQLNERCQWRQFAAQLAYFCFCWNCSKVSFK